MRAKAFLALLCAISILVPFTVPPPKVNAQDLITVGAIIVGARKVLDKLSEVGATLTGDAQIAVGDATQHFSDLIHQVEELARNDFATPINNLGSNIRIAVDRLQEVTTSLNSLVSKQRECIFQRLDLFVSGIQTIASDIRLVGIPVVTVGAPRLISFTFDGQITPNVVPKTGGKATIKGVQLWPDTNAPPEVQIRTADQTSIARPIPEAGASIHEFRVPVAQSLLVGHSGECLYVHVQTFKRRFLLGKKKTGEMTLPMCVPKEYERSLVLEAHVAYSITNQIERTLSGKRFGFSNSSCEDRHNVSHTEAWDAEMPGPAWRIVRVHESSPDIVNQSNISVSFSKSSVTASGWLDDATCVETIFSHTLIHDTHWAKTLAPVVAGPNTSPLEGVATTQPQPMTFPQTRICTDVPKQQAASGASTFWFTLIPYLRGEVLSTPLYQGPRKTTPNMDTFNYTDQFGGYQIDGSYNPVVINGKSQVCATLTVQGTCAW